MPKFFLKETATEKMSLSKDLVFLILQFCDEENLKKTAHMLEQETGYFFDLKYFGDLVIDGKWEEAEKYLSSFTVVEDNKYSTKIYFELRKQKFLEALDKHERAVALDILLKDLKVFEQSDKELYREMAQLLVLENFREHESLAAYGDTLSAREKILTELRNIIEANPLLQGRTRFPEIHKSRLRRLINQSLNWQHIHCEDPHPQPHIDTLFTDHKCPGPDIMQDQLLKETSLPETMSAPTTHTTSNQSSASETKTTARDVELGNLSNQASGVSENFDDSKLISIKPPAEESPTGFASRSQGSSNELPDELPRTVERVLNMGCTPNSMDFHPVLHTLLLVGKSAGDIELWDVASAHQLFKRDYMVQNVKSGSTVLSEDKEKTSSVSVNRVLWSPDGSLFGVAYSKHMVQLFSYHENENLGEKQLEIDAHVGSVNDLAFSKPHDKPVVISCGDDKLIQVWDAVTGAKQYTFEGHGAPVYSLCPQVRENIHFLFSISTSGEIKAWLFDNLGSRVTYNAPGFSCMRMAYSTDGERLFSCGTNQNGESYIVEWNETEGIIIRNYHGLSKCSSAVVQFDMSSWFLAAADDHLIKIWDMDSDELFAVIDADGDLPASPYICFNKKGSLMAVSADNDQLKVLANDHGRELLQTSAIVSGDTSESLTESFRTLAVNPTPVSFFPQVNPTSSYLQPIAEEGDIITEDALDDLGDLQTEGPAYSNNMKMPKISQIFEVSRCQSVLLTSEHKANMIRRLVYTKTGNAILALAAGGIHLLWKWVKSDANSSGEATSKYAPELWQPKSGTVMINDLPRNSSDIVTPTFSVSKNDSYLISASGGMITLYNMMTFKKYRSVIRPPPAATCIVFYPPDNNIIAVGLEDSTILIYNIRVDQLITTLQGHSKRISGFAFASTLNLLVSSSVDTQMILWDTEKWEKKKSTVLQISIGWSPSDISETKVELEKDQTHFLAVHETQLAIYETTTLRRVKQWAIANFCTRITHAVFSCDSMSVYALMRNGILVILGAEDLSPIFEIDPSSYLPPSLSSYVDPVVVAAHPKKPNQLALGLSNGEVVVIEPLESQGKWSAVPL